MLIISNNSKNRFKTLAGIITEVKIVPSPETRSDAYTMSWYVEEYLIHLCESIIDTLDKHVTASGLKLKMSEGSTKMQQNSIFTKLIITDNADQNERDYTLSALVSFNRSANTSVSVTFNGKTEQFSLSSQHKIDDVNILISGVINHFKNSIT